MSILLITVLLFATLVVGLLLGAPVVFALGGAGIGFTIFLWGPEALIMTFLRTFEASNSFILLAIPMFIFMGVMLERSGIADALYTMFYHWMGSVRGGLAMGTVVICTMFAAMVGLTGPATVTMGLIALPSMLKRKYTKDIAIGCVMAGGALGFLIPPSVLMIIYAMIARESVGRMFAGGIIPGLILATLLIAYIGIRSAFQPHLCPAIPKEERVSWKQKIISLRAIILPVLLIAWVLGSIFSGFATPSEASAMGAFGSIICAAAYGRLSWQVLQEAAYRTLRFTAMVMWIVFGATCFGTVYTGLGAVELIKQSISTLPLGPWGILIIIQLSYFILGCFLDDMAILLICLPIYIPVITALGFDSLWFGILFIVNMQMAYLTPPFGYNLFYMKGITPIAAPGTTMGDIYRSVWPFVIVQGIALALVMLFPQLALWLPNLIFSR